MTDPTDTEQTQRGARTSAFRRLSGEATWILAGQILTAAGGLAALRILTELLPPNVYGQLTLVLGFILLSFDFAFRPFIQASARFRADYRTPAASATLRRESQRFIQQSMALISALLILAGIIFGPRAGLPAWIGVAMAAVLVSDLVRTYETSLLNAAQRHRAMSLWRAIEAWARPLAALAILMLLGGGVPGVLFGYAAATLFVSLVFARAITLEGQTTTHGERSAGPTANDPDPAEVRRRVRTFVLPLLPVALMTWIIGVSDRYILAGIGSLELAGLYAATYAVVSRPYIMLGAFLDTWLRPKLYDAVSSGSRAAAQQVIKAWAALAVSTGLAGMLAFHILHAPIASLLLSETYTSASNLMVFIAAGYVFEVLSQLALQICLAYNRSRYFLIVSIGAALITLLASIALIQVYGIAGAAMAVPVYLGSKFVIAASFAARSINQGLPDRSDENQ
ncbi:MAG: lipopolysaccharide biosynthesis protein [Pseudomonadota bacterium]